VLRVRAGGIRKRGPVRGQLVTTDAHERPLREGEAVTGCARRPAVLNARQARAVAMPVRAGIGPVCIYRGPVVRIDARPIRGMDGKRTSQMTGRTGNIRYPAA
jgi:hypothetical protein